MMKDLYIFSGASEVGMAKMAFHEEIFTSKEVDVVYLPYELHCNVLPKSLSSEDIEECIKLCPSFLEVDKFHEFAKIPFHEYRRVVIWHSYDSNTLMLLYFLSYVLKRDLHYVNVCHYKREFIGKLGYDFDALNKCLKFCVRMTPEEQKEYAGYYQMLLESKGNIKIVKNGKIECVDDEFIRNMILDVLTETPVNISRVMSYACVKCAEEYNVQIFHYLYVIIFDLINEGKIKYIPHAYMYPMKVFLNQKYVHKKKYTQLGKYSSIKIFKS